MTTDIIIVNALTKSLEKIFVISTEILTKTIRNRETFAVYKRFYEFPTALASNSEVSFVLGILHV